MNTNNRRSITTALLFSITLLAASQTGNAQQAGNTTQPSSSFDEIKQVKTGILDIGYAEVGPANGQPVILVHGWPYDMHRYTTVSALLAARGYRVLIPYLRGYGTTRFLQASTPRNGQQAALAGDLIDCMDALHIDQAILGGFDWDARTVDIVAALRPERVKALVSVSGYLIGSQQANQKPLSPKAEQSWWYQFYFATGRGQQGYEANRRDFNKLIWQTASPKWHFDEAEYERSAASFDNPGPVAIVIHNYRWRLGLVKGEARYDAWEKKLAAGPAITVPTVTLEGDANGAPHPDPAVYAARFKGKYSNHFRKGTWKKPSAG
ncbi:alpha/beta hydrolase [Paraflavitalea speifideaquila]|uniref:alpha/beta fold hydrolase n=1 Tax=Paraflavitalea speifideaquila TaxID=3076558 RepID=UPI0028F0F151|nr:alpha/beta hydrolase [Paraflavitalea speifideiaquila]